MGWPYIKQASCLSLLLLLLANCRKHSNSLFPPDLYMLYNEYDSTYYSRAFVVGNGMNTPLSAEGETSIGNALFVSGNDVYVVGTTGNPQIATYWKNGQAGHLTSITQTVRYYSVFVSGPDVYIAGLDGNYPAYWKNGSEVTISIPGNYSLAFANSIFVSGSDIYLAGDISDTTGTRAAYWKNGNMVALSPGTSIDAASIYVSGSNVYVAGCDYSPAIYGHSAATLWVNGVATHLTDTATASWANQVLVSGDDVYVAGSYQNNLAPMSATYWKNNNEVDDIDNSNGPTTGNSIAVSGSTIYLGGSATFASGGSACYWTGWGLTYSANHVSSPGQLFLK